MYRLSHFWLVLWAFSQLSWWWVSQCWGLGLGDGSEVHGREDPKIGGNFGGGIGDWCWWIFKGEMKSNTSHCCVQRDELSCRYSQLNNLELARLVNSPPASDAWTNLILNSLYYFPEGTSAMLSLNYHVGIPCLGADLLGRWMKIKCAVPTVGNKIRKNSTPYRFHPELTGGIIPTSSPSWMIISLSPSSGMSTYSRLTVMRQLPSNFASFKLPYFSSMVSNSFEIGRGAGKFSEFLFV